MIHTCFLLVEQHRELLRFVIVFPRSREVRTPLASASTLSLTSTHAPTRTRTQSIPLRRALRQVRRSERRRNTSPSLLCKICGSLNYPPTLLRKAGDGIYWTVPRLHVMSKKSTRLGRKLSLCPGKMKILGSKHTSVLVLFAILLRLGRKLSLCPGKMKILGRSNEQ